MSALGGYKKCSLPQLRRLLSGQFLNPVTPRRIYYPRQKCSQLDVRVASAINHYDGPKQVDFYKGADRFIKPLRNALFSRLYGNEKGERNTDSSRSIPKLLYVQNPLVWMSNKMDFRYLRTSWDRDFSEVEFTRGAKQAIATITQMLSQSMFDSLKPLLTKNALLSLRRDAELLWADEVKRNINLETDDIQLVIPRKLHFRRLNEKKFCDIDMAFIALKFVEMRTPNPPLLFIDIIARFHRNYSEGQVPDWVVSALKVRKFLVIPPKT